MKITRKEWALFGLFALALITLLFVPSAISGWLYQVGPNPADSTRIVIAVGALAAGLCLMLAPSRLGWVVYVGDWLGAALATGGMTLLGATLWGANLQPPDPGDFAIYVLRFSLRYFYPRLAALRARGEAATPPPVRFREDGERLVIYPNRRKLAARVALISLLALIPTALAVFLWSYGPFVVGCCGFVALMFCAFLLPALIRLLWRRPSLAIGSDGITDLASVAITGLGLIPWHEIEAVVDGGPSALWRDEELDISLISLNRLLRYQPLLKRFFFAIVGSTAFAFGRLCISSLYLDAPPNEIARRVAAYVETHAPTDYLEPGDATSVRR